jgi:hypothetical protein
MDEGNASVIPSANCLLLPMPPSQFGLSQVVNEAEIALAEVHRSTAAAALQQFWAATERVRR